MSRLRIFLGAWSNSLQIIRLKTLVDVITYQNHVIQMNSYPLIKNLSAFAHGAQRNLV